MSKEDWPTVGMSVIYHVSLLCTYVGHSIDSVLAHVFHVLLKGYMLYLYLYFPKLSLLATF